MLPLFYHDQPIQIVITLRHHINPIIVYVLVGALIRLLSAVGIYEEKIFMMILQCDLMDTVGG